MFIFIGGGRGQGRAANGEDPPGQGKEDSSKIKIIFIAKLNPASGVQSRVHVTCKFPTVQVRGGGLPRRTPQEISFLS